MKPEHKQINDRFFIILTFKSMNEENEFLVLVREEHARNDYFRISCETAEEAIQNAWDRFVSLDDIRNPE